MERIAESYRDGSAKAEEEPPSSPARKRGRAWYFPNVPDEDWNDWRWQSRNRITTVEELARHLPVAPADLEVRRRVLHDFRMGITPYYLSLIDAGDPDDPILREVVPLGEEYENRAVGEEDPLAEEAYSPVPGITHRYPDRVLMVISNYCAIYCRYCTRKRIMYEDAVPEIEIDRMVDYIARTPAVRDVVVSGGDPLTLSTAKLESILRKLRAIPHLEIIRIGTRVPVALPQRIDDELCEMLSRYHPLWINVHFNHPAACTPEAAKALDRLSRAGVPLNNQSVLLRGVNDSVDVQRRLVHALMRMRVRPYYLYHCDPVRGTEHMRTTIAEGLAIMEGLRGHTSGLAVPQYVIDAPGGGGKIPVNPQYVLWHDPSHGRAILRNFQGRVFEYFEPSDSAAPARFARTLFPPAPAASHAHGTGGPAASNGNANGHANGRAPEAAAPNGNGHASADGDPVGASVWVRRVPSARGRSKRT